MSTWIDKLVLGSVVIVGLWVIGYIWLQGYREHKRMERERRLRAIRKMPDFQRMVAAMEATAKTIGEALLPAFVKLGKAAGDLVASLTPEEREMLRQWGKR